MQRIDTPSRSTAIEIQSDYTPLPPGYFTAGNPGLGVQSTQLSSTWFNGVQEELAYVIETGGGLTLSNADTTQLHAAINTMIANASAGVPRGYIDGFILTAATDAQHDMTMSEGQCRALANAKDIELNTALTKRIDAFFSKGTDQGGLFNDGLNTPVAADTWYYAQIVEEDSSGDIDWGWDIDPAGANTPSGWTVRRRVGARLTDSSADLLGTTQIGDEVIFTDPLLVNSTAVSTTAALVAAGPTGIRTRVKVTLQTASSGNSQCFISTPDQTDVAPAYTTGVATQGLVPVNGGAGTEINRWIHTAELWTDTSGQVRVRQTTSTTLRMNTLGWIDPRGRDA